MDVSFDEAEADLNNLQQLFKENKADSLVKSYTSKYASVSAIIDKQSLVDADEKCLQRDNLGQALVPEDIIDVKSRKDSKPTDFIAYKSTGNGDCLYNSASCLLAGHEYLFCYLRLLTALELVNNADYYIQHPRIEETLKSTNNVYSRATLFTIYLSEFGMSNWDLFKDHHMAITGEAQGFNKIIQFQ